MRDQFNLSRDRIHYTLFLFASYPQPVREAIAEYRDTLNETPLPFLNDENRGLQGEARAAAGAYLGVDAEQIALTDSTTMGLGLVSNGLQLAPEDEVLTTVHDYYSTHEALRLASERQGASMRKIALYEEPSSVTEDEVLANIEAALWPETRVLALTWVHSMNGVKLPLGVISELVAEANQGRDEENRLLLCVDGVHGFGIENVTMDELGYDFFIAGCHKWLRGTDIVWGRPEAWAATRPVIPSFMDQDSWDAWAAGEVESSGPTTAVRMTPGGFKPFEHQWAMAEAFRFHQDVGKDRIAERTHALNLRLKEGLAGMPHVLLHTPLSQELSAGMVCFDVDGLSPVEVRDLLHEQDIMATITPYTNSHARVAPSIVNTEDEIDETLEALQTRA